MIYSLDNIKSDLTALSEKEFLVKYLYKSDNWYFEEYLKLNEIETVRRVDLLKEVISDCLEISYNNIIIVGSAKVGCSFSPDKNFKGFIAESNDVNLKESDIDIALISFKLFHSIWNEFRKEYSIKFIKNYDYLANSIFRGFINEKELIQIDNVRKEWNLKIDKLSKILNYQLGIYHKLNFRIYRDWDDLEQYHLIGIRNIRKKINGEIL